MRCNWRELIWIPITFLALLVVYLPSLHNTPVFDDRLLTSGDLFSQYGSLLELRPRMLSYGSFVWVQDIFGQGWWKQRLVNLLIHMCVVVALWAFYREITRFVGPSSGGSDTTNSTGTQSPVLGVGFAVGFFALNPVAVYAVAYLIQRSILLATLFVVLSLWFLLKALSGSRPIFYVMSVAAYVLAVISKEHAVMAPLAAVPVYILVARPSRRRLGVAALVGTVLVAISGVVLAFRYGDILGKPFDQYSRIYIAQLATLGPDVEKYAYPLSAINQSWFFFKYGMHWFLPYGGWMSINLRPPFPISLGSIPQVLGAVGFLVVVIGGAFLLRFRDGRALVGLSVLLSALLFVTELATVWVQDPFVLYRSYLWAIGIPGLVLFFCSDLPPRLLLLLGIVMAALLSWQSLDRVFSLATPESVWADAIAKLPNDPRAVGRWFPYINRAEVFLDQNRLSDAYQDFKASSQLGDRGLGNFNIGALLGMAGKHEESLKHLDAAHKQGYDSFDLDYQRGVALAGMGRAKDAYTAFSDAYSRTHPPEIDSRLLGALGKAALGAGDGLAAVRHLTRVLEVEPENSQARLELGMAYSSIGDFVLAHEHFSAILKEAKIGPAYYGRAVANYRLGRKSDALSDIESAIRIGPDSTHLREWLAKIQAMRQS